MLAGPSKHKKQTVYTKYPELKKKFNGKFTKQLPSEILPVYKIVSKIKNRIKPTELSDDEFNDVEVHQEFSYDISENDHNIDPNMYDTLKLSVVKVIFGDDDLELDESVTGDLRFSAHTTFQKFAIYRGNETMIDFDLSTLAEQIYFSETKVLIVLNKDVQVKNCKSNTFLFYSGKVYTSHWKSLWRKLKATRNDPKRFYKEVTTNELLRIFRDMNHLNLYRNLGGIETPHNTPKNILAKKEFSSLQRIRPSRLSDRLGKPSRILTPKNTLSKTPLSSSTATPPRQFYSPITANALSARVTRSQDKSSRSSTPDVNDSILIDELDSSTSKRQPRGRKEIFKPSLAYKFKDNSFYKIKNIDFQCLYRGQWINDTLIDFFLKYFAENAINNDYIKKEHLHIFTTFFFTKLNSSPDYYENIKRWVSKIDFSSVKYIIVPINENLHWYCSIIVGFDKILQKDDTESVCTIYVFDSLRQDHQSILKPIRTFLLNYAKDKFQLELDPERIRLKPSAVPKQPNFNDCGVHVMYNVYRFFESPKGCLEIWNTENNPTRVALATFFKKKDREDMREKLRKVLKQLQSEQEHREHDSDKEEEHDGENDEEDDIVYIDAEEFNELKNKNQNTKESSTESQQKDDETASSNSSEATPKVATSATLANDDEQKKTEIASEEIQKEGERFFESSQEEDQDKASGETSGDKANSQQSHEGPTEGQESVKDIEEQENLDASQVSPKEEVSVLPTSQESITQVDSQGSQNVERPAELDKSKDEPYEEVPATQETEESQKDESKAPEDQETETQADDVSDAEIKPQGTPLADDGKDITSNIQTYTTKDQLSPEIKSSDDTKTSQDAKSDEVEKREDDEGIEYIDLKDTEMADNTSPPDTEHEDQKSTIGPDSEPIQESPLHQISSSPFYTVLEDSVLDEDQDVVMQDIEVQDSKKKRGRGRPSRKANAKSDKISGNENELIDVETDFAKESPTDTRDLRKSTRISSRGSRASAEQEPIDVDMEHDASRSTSEEPSNKTEVLDLSNPSDDANGSSTHRSNRLRKDTGNIDTRKRKAGRPTKSYNID